MPGNAPYTESPYDDTPPSTRPSSAASTSTSGGPPGRTNSMDSLHTTSSTTSNDRSSYMNQEYVGSRITKTTPKTNTQAMQFVKVGPADLYKTATEQLKKSEKVKALRKQMVSEEEDWQEPTSSSGRPGEDVDWQSNLNKWKSSRRKQNEKTLERVIEVKKNERDEEFQKGRRKSRTFSEMVEDKNKRGRRYNLVIHDDDNNDLGDLGLSTATPAESIGDAREHDGKDLDIDMKDTKSDAGFCTGSDTGSDGVFAEDNISDTSSALGDKKEAHDSLLDCGGVAKEEEPHVNGDPCTSTSVLSSSTTVPTTSSPSSSRLSPPYTSSPKLDNCEYTYDKAIENYKQFAENSTKKRTSSITSINSVSNLNKSDDKRESKSLHNSRSTSPSKGQKNWREAYFFQ